MIVADRTNLAKGKEDSSNYSAPIHTKSKSRVSQLNQKMQGATDLRGNQKKQYSQGDTLKHDQTFKFNLADLIVFKVGSSMETHSNSLPDMDMSNYDTED